jgi:prepilin-type N-terminal cleavage/methylation domain-containing protein
MRRTSSDDAGFTLIEVLIASVILGVLMAIAVGSYTSWQRLQQSTAFSRDAVGQLRQVEQLAVTQNTAFRVSFTTSSLVIAKYDTTTDTWQPFRQLKSPTTAVYFANPSFVNNTSSQYCFFTARGTASNGTVQVRRIGDSHYYTISVERLTGRVTYARN